MGRGRTVRSIITGRSEKATELDGLSKGKPILGMACKGRQGGQVGGWVQQGPR